MNDPKNIPSAIAGLVSEAQTREPYKHACRGQFTPEVTRANTRPYSAFTLRSNARWFPQKTADRRTVHVSNVMFDPRELAVTCAQLSGLEPKDGFLQIPVKVETTDKGARYVPDFEAMPAPVADRVEIAMFSAEAPVSVSRVAEHADLEPETAEPESI
jgi:hypothetical protein